jgi:hypothetical protein
VKEVVFENDVSSNQKLYGDRIMKVLVHRTKCVEEVWNFKKNKMPYFPVYKNIPHSQSSVFGKAPVRNVFNLVYDGEVSPDFSDNEVGKKILVL